MLLETKSEEEELRAGTNRNRGWARYEYFEESPRIKQTKKAQIKRCHMASFAHKER